MARTTETPRGRPRSEHARVAILEATRDLLATDGWDSLSIDQIATRAKVGKQTVYRWWPNKGAILAECITEGYLSFADQVPQTENWRVDVEKTMDNLFVSFSNPTQGPLAKAMIAAAAADVGVASRQYEALTSRLHDQLVARLEQGTAAGQIRRDADLDTAVALLVGAPLYWLLTTGPAERTRSTQVLSMVLESIAVRPVTGS